MIHTHIEGPTGSPVPVVHWTLDSIRSHIQFALDNDGFRCSDSKRVSPVEDQIDFDLIHSIQQWLRNRSTIGLHNSGFRVPAGWDVHLFYSESELGGFQEGLVHLSSNFYFDDFGLPPSLVRPHKSVMNCGSFRELYYRVREYVEQARLDQVFFHPSSVFRMLNRFQRRRVLRTESGFLQPPAESISYLAQSIQLESRNIRKSALDGYAKNHCAFCLWKFSSSELLNDHYRGSPDCLQFRIHST